MTTLEAVSSSLDDFAKLTGQQRLTIDAQRLEISELREALGSVLPILDAVKYSSGLGRSQLQRLEAARTVLAKSKTGEAK